MTHGDLSVDFGLRTATLAGQPLGLTPTEFRLLGTLVRAAGQVLTREQLIEKALGPDFEGLDRNIDVHIVNLRRKLGDDRAHPGYIRTVHGAGHRFQRNGSDP